MMLKDGNNWQCPFCRHWQVLGTVNHHVLQGQVASELNKHGITVAKVTTVECMNSACREIAILSEFGSAYRRDQVVHPSYLGRSILAYNLRPSSVAKPQHASVPAPLIVDYEEACAIISASPKASATLARRCLQGMIRDFCDVRKGTLAAEIAELNRQVEANEAPRQVSDESISAIDAVRQIGNIGAHFEKDINLIVDVSPEEAHALIGLIELLFEEWYVARYERQQRLSAVRSIATAKQEARRPEGATSEK